MKTFQDTCLKSAPYDKGPSLEGDTLLLRKRAISLHACAVGPNVFFIQRFHSLCQYRDVCVTQEDLKVLGFLGICTVFQLDYEVGVFFWFHRSSELLKVNAVHLTKEEGYHPPPPQAEL